MKQRLQKITSVLVLAAMALSLGALSSPRLANAQTSARLTTSTEVSDTHNARSLSTFGASMASQQNLSVSGIVVNVSSDSITVLGTKVRQHGRHFHRFGLYTFAVTDTTLVFRKGMGLGAITEVGRGDKVQIWSTNASSRQALVIWDQSIWMTQLQGKILGLNATTGDITLSVLIKGSVYTTTAKTNTDTTFMADGSLIAFADLTVGETVNVRGVWHSVTKVIDATEVDVLASTDITPVVKITQPLVGAKFISGQAVNYAGSCMGTLGQTLDQCTLSWEVTFYHNGTSDVVLGPTTPDATATTGSFTPSLTADNGTDAWYRIELTVQNGDQTKVATRDIKPRLVLLSYATVPAGLTIDLNGQTHLTPYSANAVVGVNQTVNASTPQLLGGLTYTFSSWSDSGAAMHTFAAPMTSTTYTATYVSL